LKFSANRIHWQKNGSREQLIAPFTVPSAGKHQKEPTMEIDRNDPCPCGSGIKGTRFTMQLDLFSDNRHTILMNEAGEALRVLDLDKALAIYADLLNDKPDDRIVLQLQSAVGQWRDNLSAFHVHPLGSEPLHDLWLQITDDTPPPLAAGVLQQ
jgi:hypothetical protein